MDAFFRKISVFIALLAFFSVTNSANFAHAQDTQVNKPDFYFTRDLRVGSVGEDVRELQKVLNKDPETQILGAGTGSPGQESTYFGEITRQSVIKFQNKYKDEVLRPVGLTYGTGSVGMWTRLKLNQIIINAQVGHIPPNPTTNQPVSQPQTIISPDSPTISSNPSINSITALSLVNNSKDLSLSSLSGYTGKAGAIITLYGTGFSLAHNTVHFGTKSLADVVARNNKEISFTIPNDTKPGRYDVTVTVSGKVSNAQPFMVTVPSAVQPVVEKIEPQTITFGQKITISGRNFAKTDNIVTTGAGILRNVSSSDGKTIVIAIPAPDYISGLRKAFLWPIKIHVVNENGMSATNAASGFTINVTP